MTTRLLLIGGLAILVALGLLFFLLPSAPFGSSNVEVAPPSEADEPDLEATDGAGEDAASPTRHTAAAQRAAPSQLPSEGKRLLLQGIVLDMPYPVGSGDPVPAQTAHVRCRSFGKGSRFELETLTGADGRFRFELPDSVQRPLHLELCAREDDHRRLDVITHILVSGFEAIPEQRLERFAKGDLAGRVLDEDLRPLAGVLIQPSESRLLPSKFRAITDGQGRFVVHDLPLNCYPFASKEGYRMVPIAPPISLPLGGWPESEIRMLRTGGRVVVRVSDPQGRVALKVIVVLGVDRTEFGAHPGMTGLGGSGGEIYPRLQELPDRHVFEDVWIGARLRVQVSTDENRWEAMRMSEGRALLDDPHGGQPILVPATGALELHVILPDAIRVHGEIVDPSGAPIPHAEIQCMPPDLFAAGWRVPISRRSDDQGRFELSIVRPIHPLRVDVRALTPARENLNFEEQLQGPGVHSGRQSLDLASDSPIDLQVRIQLDALASIRGIVRGADGSPALVDVRAIATPPAAEAGLQCGTGRTDAKGRFEILGLAGGLYDLDCEPLQGREYGKSLQSQRFPGIQAGSEDVQLVLDPGLRVDVTIEVSATGSVPAAMTIVTAYHLPPESIAEGRDAREEESFDGRSGWPRGAPLGLHGPSGGAGQPSYLGVVGKVPAHRLPSLIEGWYWIGVDARDASGRSFRPCGTGPVHLARGAHRFRFELQPSTEIEGRILNGGDRQDLCVGLVDEAGTFVEFLRTRTSLDSVSPVAVGGRFALQGAPPGNYRVRAGTEEQLRRGEYLAEARVALTAAKNETVDLELPR